MRFVTATGFVLDDVYVAELFYPQVLHPNKDLDRLRITWTVDIKPLAVDEILWAAFMPDEVMGPQKRINRRVNGAFKVQPLRIGSGHRDVDGFALGVLSSSMFIAWMRAIGGRIKSDLRFSNTFVYNTFPLAPTTVDQRRATAGPCPRPCRLAVARR